MPSRIPQDSGPSILAPQIPPKFLIHVCTRILSIFNYLQRAWLINLRICDTTQPKELFQDRQGMLIQWLYVFSFLPITNFSKVFSILWHENAGSNPRDTQTVASQGIFTTRYGEKVFSTIRRMVVVKEHAQCAWCLYAFNLSPKAGLQICANFTSPIYTYNRRGVSKYSADAAKHSIVYTEGTRPMAAADEPRMSRAPIEIRPNSLEHRLDPMSRLNFSKLFTVEYNVKVLPVGKVTERSMPAFLDYARQELSIS